MQLSTAIRQRIINIAKSKNMSFIDLCKEINLSYSTLMSFMNGKSRTIRIDTLLLICDGFKIDLIDFFKDPMFEDVVDEPENEIIKK